MSRAIMLDPQPEEENVDAIENEVDEIQQPEAEVEQPQEEQNLPEKYQGKSLEEVVQIATRASIFWSRRTS